MAVYTEYRVLALFFQGWLYSEYQGERMIVAFEGVWTKPVESRAMDWVDFFITSSFTLAS